ncbi:hypothetical protein O3P69_011055 [Scylla paramamosain]|uniref:Uncharacterized protein n=1 Tax=Scylla paramamosain TaxID=85552 RepID=A0AAW0STD6_SCYPA
MPTLSTPPAIGEDNVICRVSFNRQSTRCVRSLPTPCPRCTPPEEPVRRRAAPPPPQQQGGAAWAWVGGCTWLCCEKGCERGDCSWSPSGAGGVSLCLYSLTWQAVMAASFKASCASTFVPEAAKDTKKEGNTRRTEIK